MLDILDRFDTPSFIAGLLGGWLTALLLAGIRYITCVRALRRALREAFDKLQAVQQSPTADRGAARQAADGALWYLKIGGYTPPEKVNMCSPESVAVWVQYLDERIRERWLMRP